MIARVWNARARRADADAYGEFLERTAHPDYGGAEGNRGWLLLRRDAGEEVEFSFVSLWDSIGAVERYAGADALQPKHYPEDDRYVIAGSERLANYVVVGRDGG